MALFNRKERFLGVDISISAVKLIEISRSGQRYQVESIAIEPIPEGAMADRMPQEADKVVDAIRRAHKNSGSRIKSVAIAVPTSSVITRTIPMPNNFREEDIESNLQVEAAQYIPFPLEEIYLDFQATGVSKTEQNSQDVMLVASRRENVDMRVECVREAGLKPVVVDVEAYALENIYRFFMQHSKTAAVVEGKKDSCIALVDIGATITTLYIFQGGRVIFTREQPFGGDQLTMVIADTYGMSREKAELAKRSGEISEDYSSAVLAPFCQTTVDQIGSALQFFFSSSHYASVDQILLCGGGAAIEGLEQGVSESLGVPAAVVNPFEYMGSANRVNRRSLLRDGALLSVACGLALRSLD